MNTNIKGAFTWIREKIRKYPVFMRILTQVVLFITTFGLHHSSPFWHVVCLGSMIAMSVMTISDGKLRKTAMEKSDEVVDILQGAITELVENASAELGISTSNTNENGEEASENFEVAEEKES